MILQQKKIKFTIARNYEGKETDGRNSVQLSFEGITIILKRTTKLMIFQFSKNDVGELPNFQ